MCRRTPTKIRTNNVDGKIEKEAEFVFHYPWLVLYNDKGILQTLTKPCDYQR